VSSATGTSEVLDPRCAIDTHGATPGLLDSAHRDEPVTLALTDEQAVDVGHDLGEHLVDTLLPIDVGDQPSLGIEPE
jgi:hypothetical protein